MDRASRILGVWIVGCMILGGSLVIANVPHGQPWSDQAVWLVSLGVVAITLGFVGIAAEVAVLWQGRQRAAPVATLDMTPEALTEVYQTHTDVQATVLSAPYIGQYVRITRSIADVRIEPWIRMVSFGSAGGQTHVMAMFGREWSDRLRRLQRGQVVTVIGRIEKIGRFTLSLENSRIEPPPA